MNKGEPAGWRRLNSREVKAAVTVGTWSKTPTDYFSQDRKCKTLCGVNKMFKK